MTGIELIAQERKEQIEKHGWTAEHDQNHDKGELARVAATLAVMHTGSVAIIGGDIWGLRDKLAGDPIHALKVAGALIAAEIDRLQSLPKAPAAIGGE